MTTQCEPRRVVVMTRVLLLTLLIAPINACRDHELLAPTTPRRVIPKPNRSLSGSLSVSSPVDMDTSGAVAGISSYGTQVHAALGINGTAYDLGTVLGSDTSSTYAAGMNNGGQVVGMEYDGPTAEYGFLWTPNAPNGTTGKMHRLDGPNGPARPIDINDRGEILGSHLDGNGIVLWNGAEALEVPSPGTGGTTRPQAINKYGQVAGTVEDANGATHGFLWTPAQPNGTTGSYLLLDAPAAGASTAVSLNDFGQVVVNGINGDAQLWTPTTPNAATGSFTVIAAPFGPLTGVDINNRGDVLATGGGPSSSDCGGPTTHLYLLRPTVSNGTTGGIADVTPEVGGTNGWGYATYCSASAAFLSEEENATIQAFGQLTDSYYCVYDEVWTLGDLDEPPLAATISWSGAPNEGNGLYFDGGLNNPYSSGWSYHWDFGDGATATDRITTHAYSDNGQYTVRLTVSDQTGAFNTTATAITVNNLAPTGTFSITPQYPAEGSTYVLSITNVQDVAADLPSLQLALDCGDGRGYQSVAIGGSLACSAPNEVVRTARAQLQDKDGGVTPYSAPVTVVDVAPTVSIAGAPTTISEQTTYTLSFTFTDPGVLDTWNSTISWGDGSMTGPISASTQGQTLSASHRYNVSKRGGVKSATYGVQVAVSDNGGATGYAGTSVFVTTNAYHP